MRGGGYVSIQTHPSHGYSKPIIASPKQFYNYQETYSKGKQIDEQEVLMLLEQEGFKVIMHKKIIGFFAQAAWELDYAIRRINIKYARTLCLPILKLLCCPDFFFQVGNKNEWIVIAQREK